MGHMKWIFALIQDGTFGAFKASYTAAKEHGLKEFLWDGHHIDVNYAFYVCQYVEKFAEPLYNEYIDDQAEEYAEWQSEILMGK
jgi:hypothetical protein